MESAPRRGARRADRLVESIERRAEAFDAETGHEPVDEQSTSAEPVRADE